MAMVTEMALITRTYNHNSHHVSYVTKKTCLAYRSCVIRAKGGWLAYPDVSKNGRVGALAVAAIVLSENGGNGHSNTNKAVLIDADPDNVEPGEAALWSAPGASLSTAALGEPVNRQDPALDRAQVSKEFLLRVQVGCRVVAYQAEKGGNGKGLVAV